MKFLVVLATLIAVSVAQRPMYAGSRPIGRPDVASRFKDPDASTTVRVFNRIGEDGTTAKIPVDALGDRELVDRLNQWPKENRPFWLLNAEHIEAHRNPQQNLGSRAGFNGQETIPIRPPPPRSSFLSSRSR